jgi:hypothetical protein
MQIRKRKRLASGLRKFCAELARKKKSKFPKNFGAPRAQDEESVERKASRKEREGRARKGEKTKTTGGQGKHYGTSRLEQHPYSRGKR